MFQKFLNSLKRPGNESILEAIQKGYQSIFEVIDYRPSKESEAFLNQFGVTGEYLNYIGSGDFGTAYSMGNGKVFKITSSKSEFEIANEIMKINNLDNIATIFATAKTPSGYLIAMEELEEDSDIEYMFSLAQEVLETQGLPTIYIGNFDEDDYVEQNGEIDPKLKKFMDELSEVVWDYKRITGDGGDIRSENMGRSKDGTLKAFDIDDRYR